MIQREKFDRRGIQRTKISLKVNFATLGHFGPALNGQMVNVSPGGMFLKTSKTLDRYTKVKVTFSDPYFSKPITLIGTVVRAVRQWWGTPRGLAIAFYRNDNEPSMKKLFMETIGNLIRHGKVSLKLSEYFENGYIQASCNNCAWAGKASRIANRCPKCHEPVTEQS